MRQLRGYTLHGQASRVDLADSASAVSERQRNPVDEPTNRPVVEARVARVDSLLGRVRANDGDGLGRSRRLLVVCTGSVMVLATTCGILLGLLETLPTPVVDQARAARALAVVESKRASRGLVWVGSAPPLLSRCQAFGRRDVARVGGSVRFVVDHGHLYQTAGAPVRKALLVALSVLAGCPHQVRFLLSQRVTVAFTRDRRRLFEPDRSRRVLVYEIWVSRRPSIELDMSRSTLELVGARVQERGLVVRSTFLPTAAPTPGVQSAQMRHA
jgi:hypothetical protein